MQTFSIKQKDINHDWHLIDANGKTLGRLASKIAFMLRGKHKPEYTPHMNMGACVVVINAAKIKVSGNKFKDKTYYSHSGFTGGIKSITFDKLLAKFPERILQYAVKGMMPKGPLGRAMLKNLKIYSQEQHPHSAQQPQVLAVE